MEGCTCQYSVHQPLTAFSEISTCVLEIADLSVDPTTMHDSRDQAQTSVTCWAIMCTQSSWRMTDCKQEESLQTEGYLVRTRLNHVPGEVKVMETVMV